MIEKPTEPLGLLNAADPGRQTADCGDARELLDAAAILAMAAVVVIAAAVILRVGLRVLLG